MNHDKAWVKRVLALFYAVLALAVPALVAYDIYYQCNTPAVDLDLNWQTGLVRDVLPNTLGDYAGFHRGDVILTVEGVPFADWQDWRVQNYQVEVDRGGRPHTLELPIVPMAKLNLASLVSAAIAALTFWAVGLLLILRCFGQWEVSLLFTLSQAFAGLLLFPLAHPYPSLIPLWANRLSSACFYLAAPLLLHYYLTFPVPLGTPRQRRWGLGAIYALALVSILFWLAGPPLSQWSSLYAVLQVVAAVIVLVYVYLRRASPADRRRMRLVVLGNLLAAGPPLLLYIFPIMRDESPWIPEWLTGLFLVIAPLSYLYATMRHNLFDIDRLLNRALVYTLLSLGILALYMGPFLLLYPLLQGDLVLQMVLASGLTLLVGLGFDWTRTRVQRLVDRIFYGGWYDYPGVVEAISDALSRSLAREQLADVLIRQVPEMMQLQQGQLWIAHRDKLPQPEAEPSQLCFPLSFQGQPRGLWTVFPHLDGEELTPSDQRILQTLAHQAEIALSNVLLVEALREQLEEIRASRRTLARTQQQLLRSREEERARLARDLHDGPIQDLVGLNLQLGLLLALNEATPVQAPLDDMRAEVRGLLTELRQVCAELRPPMLDTLGLGAALRALTEDWSAQHGVNVVLELPADAELRSLPGEVAVNFYRVVQEALSNVARHAGAGQVAVRLGWDHARLVLKIQDDGRGFIVPAALTELVEKEHFGLVGIQERVDLIGGDCAVSSTPGRGTTLRVDWQQP